MTQEMHKGRNKGRNYNPKIHSWDEHIETYPPKTTVWDILIPVAIGIVIALVFVYVII